MKIKQKLFCAAVLTGIFPGIACAGGIYIYEETNSVDNGYGSAGIVARAQDSSTVFTNPAGMTRLKESNTLIGATPLYIHAPYGPGSDTTVSGTGNGVREFFAVASGSYVRPLNDKWSVGISAHNYFGLLLNWGTSSVNRYDSTQAVIIAPQIQPTVAYKLNDAWSIGAGAALTLGYLKDRLEVDKLTPGDAKLRYSDTDFAWQGNFGLMYEPSENTRVGLRYLTEADLDFKDDARISGLGPNGDISGQVIALDLGMTMPQSLMLGIWQRVSDRWAVLGSVGWDDWSRFGYIDVDANGLLDGEIGLVTTVDAKFKDTYHIGTGAEYQASDKLMYTFGASYDSEMSNDKNRLVVLPMGDQYRLGGGIKYAKRDDLTLGGSLSIFYEGDLPVMDSIGSYGQVSGEYKDVWIMFAGLYANWK
jgi:long-chain fatty acid transport protein